jgi:hypothetical protein
LKTCLCAIESWRDDEHDTVVPGQYHAPHVPDLRLQYLKIDHGHRGWNY